MSEHPVTLSFLTKISLVSIIHLSNITSLPTKPRWERGKKCTEEILPRRQMCAKRNCSNIISYFIIIICIIAFKTEVSDLEKSNY